jgi:hypothetical protein
MSRHAKRTRANPRTRQHRTEAKARRRKARQAKGRTKSVAANANDALKSLGSKPVRFIGGVPQHTADQRTRAMLGLR